MCARSLACIIIIYNDDDDDDDDSPINIFNFLMATDLLILVYLRSSVPFASQLCYEIFTLLKVR